MPNFTKFERIEGPHGVPIYHLRTPSFIESVAMRWVMWVGGADDVANTGIEGVYHCFEHVPFRGTRKYPNGYASVKGPIVRNGGKIGAGTSDVYTSYWAHVPKNDLLQALDVITDLVAAPLCRHEDMMAERDIILEELRGADSDPGKVLQRLSRRLYLGDHPLAASVIGTAASLDSIEPATLFRAHELGYSRNRLVGIIAGDFSTQEVLDAVGPCIERIPIRDISERRCAGGYGLFPEWEPGRVVEPWPFGQTLIAVSFPLPPANNRRGLVVAWVLRAMLTQGGLASPLYRILREERQIVYSAGCKTSGFPDGGWWSVGGQCALQKCEKAEAAIWDVLGDADTFSQERLDWVRSSFKGGRALGVLDPDEECGDVIGALDGERIYRTEEEHYNDFLSVSLDEILAYRSTLTPELAKVVTIREA